MSDQESKVEDTEIKDTEIVEEESEAEDPIDGVVLKYNPNFKKKCLYDTKNEKWLFDSSDVENILKKREPNIVKRLQKEAEEEKKRIAREASLEGDEFKKHTTESAKKAVVKSLLKPVLLANGVKEECWEEASLLIPQDRVEISDSFEVSNLNELVLELKSKPHLKSMFNSANDDEEYFPVSPHRQGLVPRSEEDLTKMTPEQYDRFKKTNGEKVQELLSNKNKNFFN